MLQKNCQKSQGFTLLELLLSLLLTALMVMGIAQYLLVSSRVHLIMQQETLASQTLENFLLQASLNEQSKEAVKATLASTTCPNNATTNTLDFTYWCQAISQLPQLKVRSSNTSLSLEWQALGRTRRVSRQPIQ